MDISYQSFADSKPFKFLVGPAAKPFYMHVKLATQLSSSVAALVESGMVETKREYAVFEDIDEDTFVRVIQFAYTGDYAVAEPDIVLYESDISVANASNHLNHEAREAHFGWAPAPEPGPELEPEPEPELPAEEPTSPPEQSVNTWNFGSISRSKKPKKSKPKYWADSRDVPYLLTRESGMSKGEQLWDFFKSEAHIETKSWKPEVNEDHCQDYTPVFLCHTRLYAFSDQYGIEPLRELVLQKLRLTLARFKLHSQRVGDVVEMLKYTYANTAHFDEKIDKLRNLVTDYLVCHIEKIVNNRDFTELLGNGDLAKDLLPKLVNRRLD